MVVSEDVSNPIEAELVTKFDRRYKQYRQIDRDSHDSFVNHVHIGVSVVIALIFLLALYMVGSISYEYGTALNDLPDSNFRSNTPTVMIVAFVVVQLVVMSITAYCIWVLVKLRRALIDAVELAFRFRQEEL